MHGKVSCVLTETISNLKVNNRSFCWKKTCDVMYALTYIGEITIYFTAPCNISSELNMNDLLYDELHVKIGKPEQKRQMLT